MNAKEVVKYVQGLKELKSTNDHIYYLTHTYNNEPNRKTWIKAPYEPEVFEIICAFIQYECSEIEQSFSIDEDDVLEVLEKHYGCTGKFSCIKQDKKNAGEIDLYVNWEVYCGQAGDIQEIELLHREGLNELFNKFVEEFYQTHPEWRPNTIQ